MNSSFDNQIKGHLSLPKPEANHAAEPGVEPEADHASEPGVVQKNNKESSADDLKLQMVGQTKTKVVYHTGTGDNRRRHEARETKEFLSYDMKIADFDGKVASGIHSFPFSVTLPEGVPPSMEVGCETSRPKL